MDQTVHAHSNASTSDRLMWQENLIGTLIDGLDGDVDRIDTHASTIILTGDFAYKIKRAVKYPYLNYETLHHRKTACEKEFALNKKISPDLYLDVLPVVETDGGLVSFGTECEPSYEPIEWAIKMRRFDQSALFSTLIHDKKISRQMIEATARLIASMHAQATGVDTQHEDHGGGAEGLNNVTRKILEELTRQHDPAITQSLARVAISLSAQITNYQEQLNNRLANGFVRHCHGDLHLGNICLLNDKPALFDAVEFNDRVSNIDCLFDVAFAWMDLIANGAPARANMMMNTYLPYFDRYEDCNLIGFFMALRALVRAMVGYAQIDMLPRLDRQQTIRKTSRHYFTVAESCLAATRPSLIIISGLSGAGKTTLARSIAPHVGAAIGAVHLRSDVIRKIEHGVDPLCPLPKSAYTPECTDQVYAKMLLQARAALTAGMPVILDAVFANEQHRRDAMQLAEALHVPFTGVWLNAPLDSRLARVSNRNNDASDADVNIARAQARTSIVPPDWLVLNSNGTPDNLAMKALACLAQDGHRVTLDTEQRRAAQTPLS